MVKQVELCWTWLNCVEQCCGRTNWIFGVVFHHVRHKLVSIRPCWTLFNTVWHGSCSTRLVLSSIKFILFDHIFGQLCIFVRPILIHYMTLYYTLYWHVSKKAKLCWTWSNKNWVKYIQTYGLTYMVKYHPSFPCSTKLKIKLLIWSYSTMFDQDSVWPD